MGIEYCRSPLESFAPPRLGGLFLRTEGTDVRQGIRTELKVKDGKNADGAGGEKFSEAIAADEFTDTDPREDIEHEQCRQKVAIGALLYEIHEEEKPSEEEEEYRCLPAPVGSTKKCERPQSGEQESDRRRAGKKRTGVEEIVARPDFRRFTEV
jgi:hypothetical protein